MFATCRILLLAALTLLPATEVFGQSRVQITIGNYGRGIGVPFGPPIGVGPVGPGFYGVPPSLPFVPRGRGIVPVPIPVPYYSGYRGYNVYIPAPPSIQLYSYSPYANAVPNSQFDVSGLGSISGSDYPYSGSGPYSGPSSSNYSPSYRAPAQTDYLNGTQSRGLQSGPDDLRPGMVLPDGATVLSVDPPSAVARPSDSSSPVAPNSLPVPTPTPTKPGRTAF